MTFDKALQNLHDVASDPDTTADQVSEAVRALLRTDASDERPARVFSSPSHDYSVWYE